MEQLIVAFNEVFSDINWRSIFLGFSVLILGQVFVRIIQFALDKMVKSFLKQEKAYAFHKVVIYSLNLLIVLLFLKVINVELKIILGAAGFLTVAIGFAARTSISNLIGGFFLIFEKPFMVGDVIEINDVKGVVLSLDLLCVRVRTFDNLMVRIPNETVVGAAVRNHTFFPIRRFQMNLVFSHKESLTNIHKLLMKVAEGHELALKEPLPYFQVTTFAQNYIEVEFKVWCSREDYFAFQTEFPKAVHRAIKNSGIDQPYQSIKLLERPNREEERNS